MKKVLSLLSILLVFVLASIDTWAASEPSTQARYISFTVSGTTLNIRWVNGDGAYRVVMIRQGSACVAPSDNISENGQSTSPIAWSALPNDAASTSNQKVAWNSGGTGNSVSITGLTAGQTYHVAVYEYNTGGGAPDPNYNVSTATGNPRSKLIPGTPSDPTSLAFASRDDVSIGVSWTAGGSNVDYYEIDLATDNTYSTHPIANYTTADIGNITSFLFDGLTPETNYYWRIRAVFNSQNGNWVNYGSPSPIATLATEPNAPTYLAKSGACGTNTTTTTMNITWTPGSGTTDNFMVFVRPSLAPTAEDPTDGNAYDGANANYSSAPNKFKTTGKMVYNGSGTSMTITGLTQETDYYFHVYAYNGTGTEANNPPTAYTNTNNYNISELVAGPFPTLAQEPAQNTTFALNGFTETTLSFQWSDADGLVTDYMIVARQGSSTTWSPEDGCEYLGTPGPGPISWSTVTTFGPYNTDNYIGYRDTNNLLINPEGIQFTNLSPGTQYSFTLYPMREVSNAGTDENWNTTTPITVTRYTLEDTTCITGGPGNPTYTNVQETQMDVNWTAATNTCTDEQYIVIARQGGAPSANGGIPVDGTVYTANSAFGSGDIIGTGNYVVYKGTGTSVTVTGLSTCTQYCFDVYVFRGNGLGSENYYTTAWGASCRYTLTNEPTVAPSNIFFTNLGPNSYTINWTAGDGNKHLVVGKLASAPVGNPVDATTYTANSVFGTSGTEFNGVASNGYVVFATTGNSINVTGLTADANYFWTVWTYNECGGGSGTENYLLTSITASRKTLALPPGTCPSALTVTAYTNNSLTLGWTAGASDGTYLLVARQGSAVSAAPPPVNGDVYYANANYGTGGTEVGTGYCVYKGTGTSVVVTGLSPATVYYFRLFNFNGSGGSENYVDCGVTANRTTLADPVASCPTGITFSNLASNQYTISWAPVTGAAGYAVVGRQGAYPSSSLIDGNDYSGPVGMTYTGPSTVWGTASADFNGDPSYVVYHSTGTSVTVTNLSSCTDYYWDVYAYTGSGDATNYTGPCQANRKTLYSYVAPPNAPVGFTQGTQTNTSLTIQFSTPAHPSPGWYATHVLVVAKAGAYSSGTAVPQNGVGYTASSDWSAPASQIGGGNVVYIAASAASTTHTVTLTNLNPCTTYYFDIYEFGQCGSDNTTNNYATSSGEYLQGTHTTLSNEPTAPAAAATPFTNLLAGTCGGTASWTYNWDNSGGADGYAVYIGPTGAVTWPTFTDGTAETATANSDYSSAPVSSLGGNALLVYNGTGNSVTITNMLLQTQMSLLVVAYNGSGVCTNWNSTTVTDTRYTLDGQPDVPTVNMTPSCSPVTTMNIAISDGSPCPAERYYVFMRQGAAVPDYSTNFVDGDAPTGYNLGIISGNTNWSSATAVTDGSGTKCVYAGAGGSPSFNVTNLTAGTQYYISIVAYNINGTDNTSNNYNPTFVTANAYTVASIPNNPSGLNITNRTPTSMTLSWTAGTGDKSFVVLKPAADFTTGPACGTGYNNGNSYMEVFGNGAAFDGTGYVVYIGTGNSVTVTGLSSCTQYYARVYMMNDGPNPGGVGAGFTNNYSASYSAANAYTLAPAPTTPPTALSFSTLGSTSYTLNWTAGNGTYHIVIGVQGSTYPTTAPVNGTTYTAVAGPTNWTTAPDISVSEKIVFNGTGTSVTITNLNPVTVYSFRVYTYNMCAGPINTTENYLATYTQNQRTTLANPPGGPVTGITFQHFLYNSYKIKWNAAPGSVTHYMVLGEQIGAPAFADMPAQGTTYGGNSDFAAAPSINPLNLTEKIVYVSTGTEVTVTGMSSNTLYSWMVIPLNNGGVNGAENYLTPGATATQSTMIAPPTVAPQITSITNITNNSFDINYTDGNGTGTLILIKSGSEPNYGPSNGYGYGAIDGNGNYSASGNFSATYPGYDGTNYETDGSSFVRVLYDGVSTGTSHTLTVTNLSSCTQYYVHIYSYNGSGSNNSYYLYPGPGALGGTQKANATTIAAEPTVAPSAASISARTTTTFTVNWTQGDGAKAIILYNTVNSFTAPTDGTVYSVGNTIGGATVAYVGTNSSPQTITLPNTCTGYYVAVYTFNDCSGGTSPNYNPTNTVTTQTYTYAPEPTAQPTGLTFGTRTTTTIPASWTAASGAPTGYVAFAKQGSAPTFTPVDGTQYTVGTTYGDAVCVYSGAGTGPANITGTADQVWYIKVYSYNGTVADCFNYYTTSPLSGSHTTLANEPTAQPITLSFTSVGNNSFTINWAAQVGSGAKYLVLINSVNSFTNPTDGTSYTANTVWQNSGQQCVYNSTGTNVAVTGLASGTTYYVQIYSFNGSNYVGSEGSENYLITSPLSGSQATTSAPDHLAITAIATPITSGTAFQVTVALHDASHNLTTWTSNIGFDIYIVSSSSGSPTLVSATGLTFNAGNTTQNYNITINTSSNLGATNVLLGIQNVVPVVNPPAPWPGTHHNSVGSVNVLATQPSQASGLSFFNPTPSSIGCAWSTSGGGNRIIVLVKQGTGAYTVSDLPVDGTGYTANTNYTLSQVINGVSHVVLDAANTTTNVTVTGLSSGTAYKFFVLAYNWDGTNNATKNYNTNPGASNNPRNTLLPRPGYPIAGDYYTDGEEGSISTFYTTPVTPNPVNESMRFNVVILDQDMPMTIKVFNALGQVVITDLENQILKSGVNEINIPTQNLTSGTYILSVSSGNEIGMQTFNVVK